MPFSRSGSGRVCGSLSSCSAGRKHVILEDDFTFAPVFSVSGGSHLYMSFSPQLQTIWDPVFL